jgi:glutamine amidotransferase
VKRRVTIVDYGLGNLHSVAKSFQFLGCEVEIAEDEHGVDLADRLVVPGVGAFADGMAGLRGRRQDAALIRYAATGRPLLGICLGAQLLLDESEEFGTHAGLGLVPGRVVRIPPGAGRVPHVGWARLQPPLGQSGLGGMLENVANGSWVYFIHSYQMIPSRTDDLSAICVYGSQSITSAIQNGRIVGLQFHPEKSGPVGLEILAAFAVGKLTEH